MAEYYNNIIDSLLFDSTMPAPTTIKDVAAALEKQITVEKLRKLLKTYAKNHENRITLFFYVSGINKENQHQVGIFREENPETFTKIFSSHLYSVCRQDLKDAEKNIWINPEADNNWSTNYGPNIGYWNQDGPEKRITTKAPPTTSYDPFSRKNVRSISVKKEENKIVNKIKKEIKEEQGVRKRSREDDNDPKMKQKSPPKKVRPSTSTQVKAEPKEDKPKQTAPAKTSTSAKPKPSKDADSKKKKKKKKQQSRLTAFFNVKK